MPLPSAWEGILSARDLDRDRAVRLGNHYATLFYATVEDGSAGA